MSSRWRRQEAALGGRRGGRPRPPGSLPSAGGEGAARVSPRQASGGEPVPGSPRATQLRICCFQARKRPQETGCIPCWPIRYGNGGGRAWYGGVHGGVAGDFACLLRCARQEGRRRTTRWGRGVPCRHVWVNDCGRALPERSSGVSVPLGPVSGHAGQGDSVGPPRPHTRANSTWVADPSGRAVGGRTAPDLRRPSQLRKAPPRGKPFRHPRSEQRRPTRAHAVEPVLGPHARTDRTGETRVAEPRLPAPEDGQPGEVQRLTPDAPHNGGRPAPLGTAPHHPRGTQSPQGMQPKGTVLGPDTHTPAPEHVGGGPQQPAQWAGSQGRDSA